MSGHKLFDWLADLGEKIVPSGSPVKVQGELEVTESPGEEPRWRIRFDNPVYGHQVAVIVGKPIENLQGGRLKIGPTVAQPEATAETSGLAAITPGSPKRQRVEIEGRLIQPRGTLPTLRAARIQPLEVLEHGAKFQTTA